MNHVSHYYLFMTRMQTKWFTENVSPLRNLWIGASVDVRGLTILSHFGAWLLRNFDLLPCSGNFILILNIAITCWRFVLASGCPPGRTSRRCWGCCEAWLVRFRGPARWRNLRKIECHQQRSRLGLAAYLYDCLAPPAYRPAPTSHDNSLSNWRRRPDADTLDEPETIEEERNVSIALSTSVRRKFTWMGIM